MSHDWREPLDHDPARRRGHVRVPGPAVPAQPRADGPVPARGQARRAALRAARVHHGRLRGARPGVPALRQGRRRRGRPLAQHLPRDPPAGPADPADPQAAGQEGALDGQDDARRRAGEVRHLLDGDGPGGQGRPAVRPRQPRRDPRDLLLPVHPRRGAADDPARLHRAHARGPGRHLLRHRPVAVGAGALAAPGGVPRQGLRGAAAHRPRRRGVGRRGARVRGEVAGLGRQGRGGPGRRTSTTTAEAGLRRAAHLDGRPRWRRTSRRCGSRTGSPTRRRAWSASPATSRPRWRRCTGRWARSRRRSSGSWSSTRSTGWSPALRDAHGARPDDTGLGDTARLLYGMALLAEGGELPEPAAFVALLSRQLEQTLPPA